MAALCVILTVACYYDYRDNRIPNYLILLAVFLGVGWRLWDSGFWGILIYLGQAVAVMFFLYPVFKIGALGSGDVKLLGMTAGYLPFEKNLGFLFCSLLVAAVFSLIKMWKKKMFRERLLYLSEYLWEIMKNGRWKLYPEEEEDRKSAGICLSGPVFVSVLLYLGGIY